MSFQKCVLCIIICVTLGFCQYEHYFVTTVNSADATAFSNSHKIATRNGELPSDTIHFVYHDNDTIYYIRTLDRGATWQTPTALAPGLYPALDIDDSQFRHVAWQQFDTITSSYDVYYDCLDDWAPPTNISESAGNSTHPDVVLDDHQTAHIVWTEEIGGYCYIYYRTCIGSMPGDTMRLSDSGSAEATYSYPSTSILGPNSRVYVAWDCLDTASYSPYQIHIRYKQGSTWSVVNSYAHYLPMRHSSLDYGHGGMETLSFCYEDSTSGNLEATFEGGSGGGYPTEGRSEYPVVSTVGDVWSYLYWQEDSAGYEDICYHFYYFMTGWNRGSVRSLFSITEPIHYPSCCGAYLVWTQGTTPPYSIFFADFGYPIATNETNEAQLSMPLIRPNPFAERVTVTWSSQNREAQSAVIYDVSGRIIKLLKPQQGSNHELSATWQGRDEAGNRVPAGIYLCVLNTGVADRVVKIVKTE